MRDLPTDTGKSAAAFYEARNDCLIDIDDSWLRCCDAVELPRRSYEEDIVSAETAHRAQQACALAAYNQAIEGAWQTYKQQVANAPAFTRGESAHAPSTSRREVIAEARATYNKAAAEIRHFYDEGITSARNDYVRAQQDARSAYEAAINQGFVTFSQSIQSAWKHFGPADGSSPDKIDPLASNGTAARSSQAETDAVADAVTVADAETVAEAEATRPEGPDFDAEVAALISSTFETSVPLTV